jgi:hypothetical protein
LRSKPFLKFFLLLRKKEIHKNSLSSLGLLDFMSIAGFDKAFEKQPSEQKTIRAEFADVALNLIVSGYVLNAVEVKVFDTSGTDVTTTMIEGTPTIDALNNYIFVVIKNGTDGKDYYVRFKTTWTKTSQPNQIDEKDLLIHVRQIGN